MSHAETILHAVRAHAGRGEWAPAPQHKVFTILAGLLGPIGSGDRYGNELAIEHIRLSEQLYSTPEADRLLIQRREWERTT